MTESAVNILNVSELKVEVARKTGAIEQLIGNLDFKLLSGILEERNDLLRALSRYGGTDENLGFFINGILSRDAITRARLKLISEEIKKKLQNLDLERKARKKYIQNTGNGVDTYSIR